MNIQTTTASGMEDFQELQYCLIDKCTIMRIDTGQQLDIVYTTQSHLVVTPTVVQTSLLIPKNEHEHFCLSPPYYTHVTTAAVVEGIILWSLIAIASGFTVAIFLLFKELRTNFGKLLMLFNIGLFFQSSLSIALLVTTYVIAVNSTMLCYIFWFSFLQAAMMTEVATTCVMAILAHIMHSSYKCIGLKMEVFQTLGDIYYRTSFFVSNLHD